MHDTGKEKREPLPPHGCGSDAAASEPERAGAGAGRGEAAGPRAAQQPSRPLLLSPRRSPVSWVGHLGSQDRSPRSQSAPDPPSAGCGPRAPTPGAEQLPPAPPPARAAEGPARVPRPERAAAVSP